MARTVLSEYQVVHPEELVIPCSDETTALTTGTAAVTFRMPFDINLSSVPGSLTTAATGAAFQFDVNENGASIFSTNPTIDVSETSTDTAATPAVLSDTFLAEGATITIDIDQVGSAVAGAGLKVTLKGTRA